jgi:hypothetical protein
VDVGRGQLDEALDQRAFGGVVAAHPGRLHQLVRLEVVAAVIGFEPGLDAGDAIGDR